MKVHLLLSLMIVLCASSAAFSQSAAHFSGEWIADAKRSRLSDTSDELVSMTMQVKTTPNSIEWYKDGKIRPKSNPSNIRDWSKGDTYSLDGKPHDNQLYPTLKVTNIGVIKDGRILITKNYERRNAMSNAVESRTKNHIGLELLEGGKVLRMYESYELNGKPHEEIYFVRK